LTTQLSPGALVPITLVGSVAGSDVITSRVAGDTFDRFVLNADGSMEWGSGAAAADITLARVSAANMQFTAGAGLSSAVILSGDAGTNRDLQFRTGALNRWLTRCNSTAEGGANAGSDYDIVSRDDAGALLRVDLRIARSSGLWLIGGTLAFGTDNAFDIGQSTGVRPRALFLGQAAITAGGATGFTLNDPGSVRKLTYKCTTTFAAFSAAALTADKVIATLPAKARVVAVYADTTIKYIGGAVATCTLRLGSTAGGVEVLASHDVFTAAVTKGLADADLGTSLVRAAAIQGGYMPSFTATTALTARITTTGANTNALTQGSTTWYIEAEVLQ
jgi:hypothetical protein